LIFGASARFTQPGVVLPSIRYRRTWARLAFEAALALSPSCASVYSFGSVVIAEAGDADRAIEWARIIA
jgi:hypothetical protein